MAQKTGDTDYETRAATGSPRSAAGSTALVYGDAPAPHDDSL